MYWPIVAELARASEPAITPVVTWQSPVALTPLGKRLLDGTADWLTQNGINRHHGGLQLAMPGAVWRWDGVTGSLLRA